MRKLLNTLYVTEENIFLSLDGETVVCKDKDEIKLRLPLAILDGIVCFGYLGCSAALMGKCAENNIALSFISPGGKFLASVHGRTRGNILLRKRQFELFASPPPLMRQNTVAAKLANSRSVVKRTIKDNPDLDGGDLSHCVERLTESIEAAYSEENHDALMGIEGNGAKAYFDVFDKMILKQKDDFCFSARTKRPPLDRVNALLSFLYTMWTLDYASALESVGLDSAMSFYHTLRPGRASLACDLVEETRCVVDRFVLTLINLKIINADDFETQISGAVFLNADGRKKVLEKWREKKKSEIMHPYLKQKISLGLLPYIQSQLLAKYVRGEIEEYPCYIVK